MQRRLHVACLFCYCCHAMASIVMMPLRLPLLLRSLCIAFFFLFSSLHAACTTAALDDVSSSRSSSSSSSREIHLDPAAARGFGNQEQGEEEEETLRFPDNEVTTLQLLKPGAGHSRLELNQMTLEKLASIEEPIAFVSVVGPYHGGKSFLLNVLLNSTQGFSVSAVPDPETQGIWIRIVPKEQLQGADNSRIILMDTEGFYGEGATRSYDARIFAIATLVSSHLIYNTLRTIGDTQSVTALADLAKQAQVFNLQNWLHSAEASTGQEEHPSAVYTATFLLLKMLDFPPLTWVVQGFDMDLSSQEPMDHLHRYLEALAHTGHRTLDTLFTHGISCHTMRTPTDLNKLREQVGGEGLAAHTELYPILHPNYLNDVDKLRDTVFKKLKAKGSGKFTGKSVAELLPLLVHYVNEDFPLNAERKLRDVLSELVIDGAFSGGTQYFQALMQNPTLPPRARGKEVDLAFVEQARKDSISALASSAFTTRELEDIMTSAEKKAIEYCKQRCVGVPPTQESSTCIVQLGTKIARMKVKYREENERRVKQVLVELGEDLRIAAEKEVEGLPLPMRDTEIEHFCKQAKSSVLQRYEALVGPHRHSTLYQVARSQIISLVQIKCDKVLLMNSEKITRLLSSGKQAYQDAYGRIVQARVLGASKGDKAKEGGGEVDVDNEKHSQKPIPPWSLVDIHKAGIKAGKEVFERNIKAAGLPWVGPGDDRYDFQLYSCLRWSKKQVDKLQDENEKVVLAYVAMLGASLALQYKEALAAITPFPDNDEVLTSKGDTAAKKVMEEFSTSVREYSKVAGVEEQRKELMFNIQETHARYLKRNTALMAAFCFEPLQEAYTELHMQECEMTFQNMWRSKMFWSPKCLWPGPRYLFGFKHAAFVAAKRNLDKAQSEPRKGGGGHDIGVVLSPATRNKVIQSWLERDLAHFGDTVLFNFSVVTAVVVIIISCLWWEARGLQQPRNRPQVPLVRRWEPGFERRSFYTGSHNELFAFAIPNSST